MATARDKKPEWLKIRPPENPEQYEEIRKDLKKLGLATVCQEAHCPNMSECWSGGTATFMIMGDTCTRGCRFCSVKTGMPEALDPLEPQKVGFAVKKMGIDYVVITTVDRDELEDQGANHFAKVIKTVRKMNPGVRIEVLMQDFRGKKELVDIIIEANPEVIGHNVETVPRLSRQVRDIRAKYDQSKEVLRYVKEQAPHIYTKSALMVGLGETDQEIVDTLEDLRTVGVEMMTIGQYLRPSQKHLKVEDYVSPERFEWYKDKGNEMGYLYVAAGPFVRSSYKAGELFKKHVVNANRQK
jgi:lipoic acid synthetase